MLFIHIGTIKTGSTAVQAFMEAHAERLAQMGLIYPAAGRRKRHKHIYLKQELRRTGGAGAEEWAAFHAECAPHADKTILISDEGYSLLGPDDITQFRRLLGDQPAQVVAYFRDYASWIPSLYAEYTKNGRNLLDFDAYFEQVIAQPTQASVIGHWADVFGWGNVCVRAFGADTLVNGDVVDDLLQVLGLTRAQLGVAPDAPVRAAPGWEALETARAVLSRISEHAGGTVEGRVPLFVRSACMEAVLAMPASGARADYLSAEQRRRCHEMTRRDVDQLNSRLVPPGLPMPSEKPMSERAFLPSVTQVPADSVATAMSQLAVLLAAQVPDGRIERKRRLERTGRAAADAEDEASTPTVSATSGRKKPANDSKRAARQARKAAERATAAGS
jgi:hypothetical protein